MRTTSTNTEHPGVILAISTPYADPYRVFRELANKRLDRLSEGQHEFARDGLRSLAMSLLPEAAEQRRRFMFLSLFVRRPGDRPPDTYAVQRSLRSARSRPQLGSQI